MTKKAKIIGSITAVCAVIGITAGAIAWAGRKNPATYTTESPFATVGDHVEGNLQTTFEGSDNIPSMSTQHGQLLASESGWYCNPLHNEGYGNITIYTDKQTGQHTPLCARPECTHDSEYCVANNSQFDGIPCCYDGYLYGLAADRKTLSDETPVPGHPVYASDCGEIYLMRYAPDGMELTKLCKLQDALEESIEYAGIFRTEIIGHKGALWISVEFGNEYGYYDTMTIGDTVTTFPHITERATGYALFHYDIAKNQLTAVIEVPMTTVSLSSSAQYCPPMQLCAAGDYLYFRKQSSEWSDPYNSDALYRVNICTGAIEKLAEEVYTAFALAGDKLVYLTTADGWFDEAKGNTLPCILDLQTGETSLLFKDKTTYYTGVQCTAEYIILTKNTQLAEIAIYDWNGKLLATLSQPTGNSEYEGLMEPTADLAVNGDCLYGQRIWAGEKSSLHYTSLSAAIANGTAEWKTAYDAFALKEEYMKYAKADANGDPILYQ